VQLLGEEITPGDAKKLFASISYDLWNGIADNDDEEMVKENAIAFLNPFYVVKNAKEILCDFQVTKHQSSVTEGMQICLPTTANFLEFLGTLDRLSKQLCCAKRKLPQRFFQL